MAISNSLICINLRLLRFARNDIDTGFSTASKDLFLQNIEYSRGQGVRRESNPPQSPFSKGGIDVIFEHLTK